jgi:segregation and condensation protein B
MPEEQDNRAAKLEALLFVYGDSLTQKKALGVLGITAQQFVEAKEQLQKNLNERGSGLTLFEHDDSLQLVTRAQYAGLLQAVVKAEMNESLTPASLETLAIIAYAGPVTRAEIDYIRGVNSSYTVRALSLRGLVDRETDPKRANVFLYRPSADLLRHLGATSVAELPDYERIRSVAASIATASVAAPETTVVPEKSVGESA